LVESFSPAERAFILGITVLAAYYVGTRRI
jgi:hypothetical protein